MKYRELRIKHDLKHDIILLEIENVIMNYGGRIKIGTSNTKYLVKESQQEAT